MGNDGEGVGDVETTLAMHGDVANDVRSVVAERSSQRVVLPELPGTDRPERLTDKIVSAYQATMYDLAVVSSLAGRSVVVDGFLQGPDWLLACDRHVGSEEGQLLPDPENVWSRSASPALDRPSFPDFDFHLRHVVDTQARSQLRATAERRARTSGHIVPSKWPSSDTLFDERWIEVVGVEPYFVRLRPYGKAILKFDRADLELGLIGFDDYPEEWQNLIEIRDPLAAVERVRTAVFGIAKSDAALRQNLDASFR